MSKKHIYYFLFIIGVILVQYFVYLQIEHVDLNADANLIQRQIETPGKLILNGYLSLLFGFKYLGNINFLILPLGLLYFLLLKPKLNKGILFLITFFVFSLGIIALKGFFNPRYALTLLPFVLFFVFYFTHKLITNYYSTKFLYLSYFILVFFVGFNFYKLVLADRFSEKLNSVLQINSEEKAKESKEVEDVLKFIDTMKTTGSFLVNNLPDFYYQTNKKGKYYWCGDDFYFGKNGKEVIFDNDIHNAQKRIIEDLGCEYVYTYKPYEKYNSYFDQFLSSNCTLIATDSEGKLLYRIDEPKD